MRNVRILLLEDSEVDAELACEQLRRGGFECDFRRVSDREGFVAALQSGDHDIILADYSLPSFDGATALELAREKAPHIPFIFVSGVLGEERAIESLKRGATDYVLKQRLQRLPIAVERALNEAALAEEARKAEERTRTLVAELNHRVKNLLALVSAVAAMTFRHSSTLQTFQESFQGRLQTLSEAHSLVFQNEWKHAPLGDLLERALGAFESGAENFQFDGPAVSIPPRHAMTLALAFHELATNASKYGSLSEPGGTVELNWRVTDDGGRRELRFDWVERGGREVTPPSGRGFGTTLIERSVRSELGGQVEFRYEPDGLHCAMRFPAPWLGVEGERRADNDRGERLRA